MHAYYIIKKVVGDNIFVRHFSGVLGGVGSFLLLNFLWQEQELVQ
jgi:hypothetical protein